MAQAENAGLPNANDLDIDEPLARLHQRLVVAGIECDSAPQLCTVQELMRAATDGKVVRVPVWRCLSDPAELLADLGC
ncbi:hypothetical protein [Saccharopolyspora pogona]|uniref:hypothetical protein n=1 Tax=Saccharopolyspora pogona TaxID=333966 RepID=UPI001682D354|nr:hypothetical protein [Saccharopolyspora pogona]